jgi:hypothetical protein
MHRLETTRRRLLQAGGSAAALSMVSTASSRESSSLGPQFGQARSCVLVFLSGGHPQHETFDPKPEAPKELRGPFAPISTNIPGIHYCELLPRIARISDQLCTIRSLATDDNTHGSSAYYYYTGTNKVKGGLPLGKTDRAANRLTDWPSLASVIGKLRPASASPFSSVILPELILNNPGYLFAGQNGGFMGSGWDPQVFPCDPSRTDYETDILGMVNEVTGARLARRRRLLSELGDRFATNQRGPAAETFARHMRHAFDVLLSGPARAAFELGQEDDSLRDLYGRNKFGQSLLLARRLVESGVRFVQVNWPREPGDLSVGNPVWDTHFDNTGRCRDTLCPPFDLGFSTFINDLGQRGLLEETLVVVLGDFGRTPKINKNGGRDHWGPVMSGVLAGAGIASGQVVGASDRNGSLPADHRIPPEDLSATIFHLMGIDPETHIEVAGRPFQITTGQVVSEVLGTGPVTGSRVPAGGSVPRLPDFNRGPLSNGDFSHGRRVSGPVGEADHWIAIAPFDAQRPGDLCVATRVEVGTGNSARHEARIGFGIEGAAPGGRLETGARAMLAQEIYNQRPGRYTFTVRIAALADPESVRAWASRFRTRIVIFRFTDLSRSLQHTAEVVSVPFAPPFGTAPIEISVSRLLKDQEGGAGELLKGIGVAVVLEHTGDPIDLAASKLKRAVLRIQQARVRFLPRDFSFASHDENRDGKLERSEVPRFLEADFDTLDANGDGSLSPAEVQG